MIRLLKHDLRRIMPSLLLVMLLALVLPFCAYFLRFIYDTEMYEIVANISLYAFLGYVVSYQIFNRNFSQLFGKEAYFYRTIPISNRCLLIEKFIVVNFGILVCILGIIGLVLNSKALGLYEAGSSYLAAYGQVINGAFTKTNLLGFLVGMIALTGFVAQAFCAGQMTMCRFLERFRGAPLYIGLGFFWWILCQLVYGLCMTFIPGVLELKHTGNVLSFSEFKMYSVFGVSLEKNGVNNFFPILGLGVAIVLMLVVPLVIYLQIGKRNVNLR